MYKLLQSLMNRGEYRVQTPLWLRALMLHLRGKERTKSVNITVEVSTLGIYPCVEIKTSAMSIHFSAASRDIFNKIL